MIQSEVSYNRLHTPDELRLAERLHSQETADALQGAAGELGRTAILLASVGTLETPPNTNTETNSEPVEQIPVPIETRTAFARTALIDIMSREDDSNAALSHAYRQQYDLAA